MIHARVVRLFFGASGLKTGTIRPVWQLAEDERHNHKMAVAGGVLAEDCGRLPRKFFRVKRALAGDAR